MKFSWLFFVPFIAQALIIGFDEFYFHIRRGLPRWERIGHPLDTLSIALCLTLVLILPYSTAALVAFIAAGVLSCLLVTKDEFVHNEECNAQEQWLHALLFLTHPLVLFSIAWMWKQNGEYQFFLTLQLIATACFALYQLVYWNFVWKEKR